MKIVPKPEAIGFSEQGLQCAHGILQEAVDRDELMGGCCRCRAAVRRCRWRVLGGVS
jgi:hypothetical protein